MSTATAAPATPPTQAQALNAAEGWLQARSAIKQLEADQLAAEETLHEYFSSTSETTVGGVIRWSRVTVSTSLVPTVKRFDRETTMATLLEDPTFTAFVQESVKPDDVLSAAAADTAFRKSLDNRNLLERRLDETAIAKAAIGNPALADALKGYKLEPSVVSTHKWYLKA